MTKEKKTTTKTFIITVSVIIVIAIAAALVYVIPQKNDASKPVDNNEVIVDTDDNGNNKKSDSDVNNKNEDPSIESEKSGNDTNYNDDTDPYKDADIKEETKEAIEEMEEMFPDDLKPAEVEAAPDVDYKRGKVTESSYESEFLGLKFNVPEGWQIVSEEELLHMDMPEGTACELQAYSAEEESNIVIIFEKLPAETITPDIYINSIVSSNQNASGVEISDVKSDEKIDIAGQQYNVLSYTILQENNTYYQRYFIRQIGDYMAVISASARTADAIDNNILSNFVKY